MRKYPCSKMLALVCNLVVVVPVFCLVRFRCLNTKHHYSAETNRNYMVLCKIAQKKVVSFTSFRILFNVKYRS